MSNYQIIVDEEKVKEFIDLLPDNTSDEHYYFCLFARKKYCKDIQYIKSDKSQLSRKTATKDRILDKIRQMECKLGSYVQHGVETIPIPQEALALYINPNPRSLKRATLQAIKKFADIIGQDAPNFNPQAEAMSCIQRSKSRTKWVDFDVDTKDIDIVGTCEKILEDHKCFKILETRGGYHVLVEPNLVPEHKKNSFYKELKSIADISGDCLLPMPGTYAGGFVPKFIEV